MAALEPIREDATEVPLRDGRSLSVVPGRREDLVEVRAADGRLELRIRLTDDGPVLELEAVRLQLTAAESVDIDATELNVRTSGEVGIHAQGDVRVTGEIIHLN